MKAEGLPGQQPLFLFSQRKGGEPACRPEPAAGKASGKAPQPKRPVSTFIPVLVTLKTWERTTLLAVRWGRTKETPLPGDSPAVKPPLRDTIRRWGGSWGEPGTALWNCIELAAGCPRPPAPPQNAAAYNRGAGKRNKRSIATKGL